MGEACNTYGRDDKCKQKTAGNSKERYTLCIIRKNTGVSEILLLRWMLRRNNIERCAAAWVDSTQTNRGKHVTFRFKIRKVTWPSVVILTLWRRCASKSQEQTYFYFYSKRIKWRHKEEQVWRLKECEDYISYFEKSLVSACRVVFKTKRCWDSIGPDPHAKEKGLTPAQMIW